MLDNYLISLVGERGDIIAGVCAFLVLIAAVVAKRQGWLATFDRPTTAAAVDDSLIDRVGQIDERLKQVEIDIAHVPTRKEFHQMALQLSALEGHVRMVERTSTATGHAVGRIEDHFIRMSGGK